MWGRQFREFVLQSLHKYNRIMSDDVESRPPHLGAPHLTAKELGEGVMRDISAMCTAVRSYRVWQVRKVPA